MRSDSTIEILGGGPAGLYTAILVRRLMPHVSVRVTEQNPHGATFGFGVVFSDRALEFLEADDPETCAAIAPATERWRDMVLNHPQGAVTIDGVGFSAIGRLELIEILCVRAEALGATMRFSHPIRHLDELDGDLIGAPTASTPWSAVRTKRPSHRASGTSTTTSHGSERNARSTR